MLNWCTMYFGDMFEVINSGKKKEDYDWSSFYYGAMCGFLPWAVMFYEMYSVPASAEIPWWAWAAVIMYFVLFMSFPYVMYRQGTQTGNYNNEMYPLLDNGGYIHGEKTYQFLSIFTKSLIAWLIAGAVVGPDTDIWETIDDNLASR